MQVYLKKKKNQTEINGNILRYKSQIKAQEKENSLFLVGFERHAGNAT